MQLLREYRQHQKAERFKVGSEWVRRVEIENGKTVDNDLLFTRWNGQPFDPNAVTSWFPGFLACLLYTSSGMMSSLISAFSVGS